MQLRSSDLNVAFGNATPDVSEPAARGAASLVALTKYSKQSLRDNWIKESRQKLKALTSNPLSAPVRPCDNKRCMAFRQAGSRNKWRCPPCMQLKAEGTSSSSSSSSSSSATSTTTTNNMVAVVETSQSSSPPGSSATNGVPSMASFSSSEQDVAMTLFNFQPYQPNVPMVKKAQYPPPETPKAMMKQYKHTHFEVEKRRVQATVEEINNSALFGSSLKKGKSIRISAESSEQVQERRNLIKDAWSKKIMNGMEVTKEIAEKIADQIGVRTAKKIPQVKAVLDYHRLKRKAEGLDKPPKKKGKIGRPRKYALVPKTSPTPVSSTSSSATSASSASSSSSSLSSSSLSSSSLSSSSVTSFPYATPAKHTSTKTTGSGKFPHSTSSSSSSNKLSASDRVTHSHIRKPAQTRISYINVDGKKTPRKQREFLGTYHHVDKRVNGHVVRLDYYKGSGQKTKCYIFNNFDLVETSAAALADILTDINQCFRARFNRQHGKGISKRFSRNFGVGATEGVVLRNQYYQALLKRFKVSGVVNLFKEAFDTMRKMWSECMVYDTKNYDHWSKIVGKQWIEDVKSDVAIVLNTFHAGMDSQTLSILQKQMTKSFDTQLIPLFNETTGILYDYHNTVLDSVVGVGGSGGQKGAKKSGTKKSNSGKR